MTARSEVVVVDPGRRVEYEGSIAWFWSIGSLTLAPSDGGTQITFHDDTTTPRWFRPLEPVLNASFQRHAQSAVDGAARYLAERSPDSRE